MRCDEVKVLLELRDHGASCDRDALASHLASCAPCSEAWPEVAPLIAVLGDAGEGDEGPDELPAFAPPWRSATRRRRLVAAASAAVLVLAIAGTIVFSSHADPAPAGILGAGEDAPARVRELPGANAVVVNTIIVHHRDQRFETSWSEHVWSVLPKHFAARTEIR